MTELLLPRLKREIQARLEELRPLVAEAAHLEAAKRALLEETMPTAPRRTAVERSLQRSAPLPRLDLPRRVEPSRAMSGSAAPRARPEAAEADRPPTQRETIIKVVEERPGVSVAEIASVTKIAKPTVATTISKLKREGVLASEAGGVKLASRQPITLAQVAGATREESASDAEWDAARPRTPRGALA